MNKLKVSVSKIAGTCTSTPPMKKGDFFMVDNGDIRISAGRFICAWALGNMMPLLPAKERRIGERRKADWMWRVHHVQCPDPAGRVVFRIEKVRGRAAKLKEKPLRARGGQLAAVPAVAVQEKTDCAEAGREGERTPVQWNLAGAAPACSKRSRGPIRPLRVVVAEVRGKCTSGHKPGDAFFLDGGRLSIPAGGHFCLYALQAVLPFVAAKARRLAAGDWLADEFRFICPDPAGNVILRIEVL